MLVQNIIIVSLLAVLFVLLILLAQYSDELNKLKRTMPLQERDCEKHGHNYQARYSTKLPGNLSKVTSDWSIQKIEALKVVTYARDVCVFCGDPIERPDKLKSKKRNVDL